MRRFFIPLAALFGLFAVAACESPGTRLGAADALILTGKTTDTVLQTTKTLLEQDVISIKDACVIDQYSALVERSLQEGWVALIKGDPQTASDIANSALDVINGVSDQARTEAEFHCAGTAGLEAFKLKLAAL